MRHMPWKESNKVTERMQFITRYQAGERISDLSKEFGISRQTGHALIKRFEEFGPDALKDRSSRPAVSPNRTARAKVDRILALRNEHPTWGPKKIKRRLEDVEPGIRWPAASTVGVILADAGLTESRKPRRAATPNVSSELRETTKPNELWCIDYKGQFRLGNRKYCYPLTVTDHFSRYLIGCEALENTRTEGAMTTFWDLFDRFGIPQAIRSDNGAPFASTGRLGLSRLSVAFMRLGIQLERIEPGKPQQNGRHERMHLTLKQDTTRPPAHGILAQQQKFDAFTSTFNEKRPHEALDMKTPAGLYAASTKILPKELPALEYPLHDRTVLVRSNGCFRLPKSGSIYLGVAFTDQQVGLREVETGTWLISFMELDVAYLDTETMKVIDLPN